jgi:dGTPase
MPELAGRIADAFEARIREQEETWLSPLGVRSYETRGRVAEEEECGLRTPFQRDRDRIVHSKSFRRLKHKTQVFIDPKGDHYRTRLTHTLETAGISRTVARALRLNEDLTEAIALGHDLGHPPFGHTGEEVLDEVVFERYGRRFRHNEQSLRVVDVLEKEGRGLNLTEEVRDGILKHTGPGDRVAYINHDIDDALRAGLLSHDDLPQEELELLGQSGARRIDRLVHDIVESSAEADDIVQSSEIGHAMLNLRAFMFERVYLGPAAQEQRDTATATVRRIFAHLVEHPDDLPEGLPGDVSEQVTDYIAGMTDRFALAWH